MLPTHRQRQIQAQAELVQEAWNRLQAGDTRASTVNAFEVAYARWAATATKSQGRPSAGDGMTSTQRAAAARQRAADNAARWISIAPLLQQLRRAVDAGDNKETMRIAKAIAETQEPQMQTYESRVVIENPDSQRAIIQFWTGSELSFLAFVAREAVEDTLQIDLGMNGAALNLVVERNKAVFADQAIEMFEAGQYQSYSRFGQVYPLVIIRAVDLEASGRDRQLDGSVLKLRGQL